MSFKNTQMWGTVLVSLAAAVTFYSQGNTDAAITAVLAAVNALGLFHVPTLPGAGGNGPPPQMTAYRRGA